MLYCYCVWARDGSDFINNGWTNYVPDVMATQPTINGHPLASSVMMMMVHIPSQDRLAHLFTVREGKARADHQMDTFLGQTLNLVCLF